MRKYREIFEEEKRKKKDQVVVGYEKKKRESASIISYYLKKFKGFMKGLVIKYTPEIFQPCAIR